MLRQAVSLGRLLLDPLIEYAHLCNTDDDILCVSYHPLQSEVSKVIFLIFHAIHEYMDIFDSEDQICAVTLFCLEELRKCCLHRMI